MNGILNILKPTGMTSHDVVGVIRKTFGIRKVGHTGTLDPNAAGVLPICIGKATKLSQYLTEKDKTYRCEMIFGKMTDTLDSYGEITQEDSISEELKREEFEENVKRFVGMIDQVPPAYSAVKVGGIKLYEKARKGKEIDTIPSRLVTIYEIRTFQYDYPRVMMDIRCSKGTYIRSLVRDLAEGVNRKAYMSLLIRTQAGQFRIEDAWTLEELREKPLEDVLIPLQEIELSMNDVVIKSTAQISYVNGVIVSPKGICTPKPIQEGKVRVFNDQGAFLGIGAIFQKEDTCCLKSETLLI